MRALAQNFYSPLCSYLFDVFLGPNYNQSPPSVKYMTVSLRVVFTNSL